MSTTKKVYLVLIVVVLFLAQLACTGGDVNRLNQEAANAAHQVIEKVEQSDLGDTIQDTARDAAGSGCATIDLYNDVTGAALPTEGCK